MNENFDNNSVTSVRKMATRLNEFCERTGVAVIALNHLTKGNQSKSMHRILGSGAWVHAPRIAWAAAEHDGELIFGKFKQNITKGKGVYKFTIDERLVNGMKEPRACIKWLEDSYVADQSINELLDMPVTTRGDHGNHALEMIQDKLRNGSYVKKQEVIAYVQGEVDISERQIERLAEGLNVQSKRLNDQNGSAIWSLPT